MAGYGYSYRGYVVPRTDEWSKESYTTDHMCRPVIIDADGNKSPNVVCTPNNNTECYVVETIVEHVRTPMVIDYRYGSPPEVGPVKDYGYKRVEPVKDYGYNRFEPVKDYGYNRVEPVKDYGYNRVEPPVKDYGYNRVEPVKDYGYNKVEPVKDYGYADDRWRRPSSPVHDRPEFFTKVQTEVSRPNRPFAPVSGWRQPYGSDYSDNEWIKPVRDDNYDDYYKKNDSTMKPTTVTAGVPARPRTWAPPVSSYEGALSKPTSDIGTAIENLKEAAKPFSGTATAPPPGVPARPNRITWAPPVPSYEGSLSKPRSDIGSASENLKEAAKLFSGTTTAPPPARYSVPISSTTPKRDSYTESIDSREAARRYGNGNGNNNNLLSRQQTIEEPYTTTITSREAAKKYGGTTV